MPFYRTKIYSGDVLEIEEYFSLRERGKKAHRGTNHMASSLRQMNMNDINSKKKLRRLINSNFKKGDLWIRLSYKNEPEFEAADKEMKKFLRRVREYRKKQGLSALKYIGITESEDKDGDPVRLHHHIIMQDMDAYALKALWNLGWVDVRWLYPDGDYTRLANYMTKTARRSHKKRWSQSRNLERPTVVYQTVKHSPSLLKPPKGYRAIEQSCTVSEEIGTIKYLRAVRIGGADYMDDNSIQEKAQVKANHTVRPNCH